MSDTRSNFEIARDHVEFRLTYDRCDPRWFSRDMLDGPMIPDAFGPGEAPGEWYSPNHPSDDAPAEAWLAHFAQIAVNEAIHEALEWFKVDGHPWLDPHGPAENLIYRATEQLCQSLAALRERCNDETDDLSSTYKGD